MKNKIAFTFISLILSLAIAFPVFALTGREIVEKSEKAIRSESLSAVYAMKVTTASWSRTIEFKYIERRKERKSFAEIYAPKKDEDNRFLLIKNNMWHYIPKLQQTIKISPSMMLQPWMGSDFSNDDIVKESSILEDYNHNLVASVTLNGQKCYKVELVPKPDAAVVWGKIIYYTRESDFLPYREEFYNEHAEMKKVMTFSEYKVMGGRTIPTVYTMKTVNKPDKLTVLEIKDVKFDIDIPEKSFTQQNLTRK